MSNALKGAVERRRMLIQKRAAIPGTPQAKKGVTAGKKILEALWRGVTGKPATSVQQWAGSGAIHKAYKAGKGANAGARYVADNPKSLLAPLAVGTTAAAVTPLYNASNKFSKEKLVPNLFNSETKEDTQKDKSAREGELSLLRRAKASAQEKAAAVVAAKATKDKAAKGEEPVSPDWVPGIDNTLTAAAGGGVAGAGAGYLLGKKLGWDPITSSLVGGLGTATTAAMLAHYLKAEAAAEKPA